MVRSCKCNPGSSLHIWCRQAVRLSNGSYMNDKPYKSDRFSSVWSLPQLLIEALAHSGLWSLRAQHGERPQTQNHIRGSRDEAARN